MATMAVHPAANPSNPSVRFTVLEVPDTTIATKAMKAGAQNTACASERKGTDVTVVGSGEMGFASRKTAKPTPNTSCPIILYRATSPRGCFLTTFR
jgi:hypothetical protein